MYDETCAPMLTSAEPIDDAYVSMSRNRGGWTVWTRHRHHSGRWQDCGSMTYGPLSDAEMVDVVGALLDGFVAVTTPLDWPY